MRFLRYNDLKRVSFLDERLVSAVIIANYGECLTTLFSKTGLTIYFEIRIYFLNTEFLNIRKNVQF